MQTWLNLTIKFANPQFPTRLFVVDAKLHFAFIFFKNFLKELGCMINLDNIQLTQSNSEQHLPMNNYLQHVMYSPKYL